MKKLLILTGYYWPGSKGGGPIRSCVNMAENLADHYEVYVLTTDRDKDDPAPYPGITPDQWTIVGRAQVYYMSAEKRTLAGFEQATNAIQVDLIYLNGFFAPLFTQKPLILRLLGRTQKAKWILTPRGDFTGGCENKKLKKYAYIWLTKLVGLYRNLLWHATSDLERSDILRMYPKAEVAVAPNLPARFVPREVAVTKTPGELRLIFVSRIFPKKNIKYALEVLRTVTEGQITFDIYGPMEDCAYWRECEHVIAQLPPNVHVQWCGELRHDEVADVFARYHGFFFPTLGENYGHVIVEAMMNNCLCILPKDVTPWNGSAHHGCYVCPLEEPSSFRSAVLDMLAMDDGIFRARAAQMQSYIAGQVDPEEIVRQYIKLLG